MNKNKIFFSFIFFLSLLLLCNICMAKDSDIINDYSITVDPRDDGSLDIVYHIEWEVLDSSTYGPLTWVKIGIPNSKVDSIRALSDNIQSIRYYKDNGDFVRIDFKKQYLQGEIVSFDFKIHQSYMYELIYNEAIYNFTPGWFDDIKVKEINIYWNANKTIYSNSKEKNSDNYLVWTKKLGKGNKLKAVIKYNASAFSFNSSKQSSNSNATPSTSFSKTYNGIYYIILGIIVLSYILQMFSGRGYRRRRGYGYFGSLYDYPIRSSFYSSRSSSSSSHSSCVSSCACACACAGGGRAGCSKKDFYGTKISTQKLNKILNNK